MTQDGFLTDKLLIIKPTPLVIVSFESNLLFWRDKTSWRINWLQSVINNNDSYFTKLHYFSLIFSVEGIWRHGPPCPPPELALMVNWNFVMLWFAMKNEATLYYNVLSSDHLLVIFLFPLGTTLLYQRCFVYRIQYCDLINILSPKWTWKTWCKKFKILCQKSMETSQRY